jgi:hypothetical protein
MFFTSRDLSDVKHTQFFAMEFFWDFEDREKKKSTRTATRRKRACTMQAHF